ncbi:MAG TPA: precorrin-3B C(17)-methyltransferase [Pseudonocardiaceae bacterium]
MRATLYGVGLGPGDPELVTVKAARLITGADVIAYHAARHGRSIARTIAEPYLRAGQVEEPLIYPVTTEVAGHPGGYDGAMEEFYAAASARLAAHLDAGRDVVLLAEGDPLFFSSYMHMHRRLAERFTVVIVPGVTAIAAAAAANRTPLVEGQEVLTVLPGTLPRDVLAEHLRRSEAVAIMKLGRTFGAVRDALGDAGRLAEARYVERASHPTERVRSVDAVDPATVPYMSLILVPGPRAAAAVTVDSGPESGGARRPGEVVVVGLGPGPRDWLTPQAQAELAAAEHIVGYRTYVDRVPANPRQQRHRSDNKVEAQRAEVALELARRGGRVAVVSSGDPGVFAMASAVLEVVEHRGYHDVQVRVVPGLTAAQAVASRVGAPLGHDFCVLSLSERLKPWKVLSHRLEAVASADFVLAVYNPASATSGRNRVGAMREVLLRHRAPDTPVVIGRAVGSAAESVRVVRLADLDPDEVDMQTLLIVGSSQTRVIDGKTGIGVYTPRTYPRLLADSATS